MEELGHGCYGGGSAAAAAPAPAPAAAAPDADSAKTAKPAASTTTEAAETTDESLDDTLPDANSDAARAAKAVADEVAHAKARGNVDQLVARFADLPLDERLRQQPPHTLTVPTGEVRPIKFSRFASTHMLYDKLEVYREDENSTP